jgi:hypothetical protein
VYNCISHCQSLSVSLSLCLSVSLSLVSLYYLMHFLFCLFSVNPTRLIAFDSRHTYIHTPHVYLQCCRHFILQVGTNRTNFINFVTFCRARIVTPAYSRKIHEAPHHIQYSLKIATEIRNNNMTIKDRWMTRMDTEKKATQSTNQSLCSILT